MAKFKYKFESIKKIKESFEKKVRKEISVIELEIESMNNSLKEIYDEIKITQDSLSGKKNIKAAELRFRDDVGQLLELKAKQIASEIGSLEKIKVNKMEELVERSKEYKMFESLEEKHQEEFNDEQNHLEQKEIDEIAIVKFARE